MINLMPYEDQKQIKAARANIMLVRYVIVMLLAIIFLAVGCVVTYLTITSVQETNKNNTVQKSSNKPVATTTNEADMLRSNLQSAKSVLDQRVAYSDVLVNLATVLPPETAIDSISLDDASFGMLSTVKIKVKSTDAEPKLKAALNSSYFSGYSMTSTTPNPDGASIYKFVVTINLTFNRVTN